MIQELTPLAIGSTGANIDCVLVDDLHLPNEEDPEAFLLPFGENPTKLWGVSAAERVRRMAAASGLTMTGVIREDRFPLILVNQEFAFDSAWIRFILGRPDHVVTFRGQPVIAHIASGGVKEAEAVASAMSKENTWPELPLTPLDFESGPAIYNSELRKRERPFLAPLTLDNASAIERASYYSAYKGVTDILTKYLWPELAFHVTRLAARLGLSPNAVTAIGAVLALVAMVAFFEGRYWLGLAVGFIFMVLDTVDGKLARCTIRSSFWGNAFDHGIDLVHPPFWWWAWGAGLSAYGRPIEHGILFWTLAVVIAGYILQRVIEGVFIRLYGMHIHVWRPVDSAFRLITARRNPNMAILFVSMIFGRPDLGLYAIAFWTIASLLFHTIRLAQAAVDSLSGKSITSWMN